MLFRLTAAAIIEREGNFLLVEEKANGGIVLNNPSGRWEPGETLIETAQREAAEEACATFTVEHLVGTYITTHKSSSGQLVCTVRFGFCGTVHADKPPIPIDQSIIAIHWLPYEKVLGSVSRHRSSAVLRCIDDFRAGIRYPLSVVNHALDDALRSTVGQN